MPVPTPAVLPVVSTQVKSTALTDASRTVVVPLAKYIFIFSNKIKFHI